ncbi:hypothetical protein BJF78_19495 [Pseudonocardia sp. CNS-139]|nr:hypothetical protein BJF78_19495 [Pseudonocardia sp. CNS-139]
MISGGRAIPGVALGWWTEDLQVGGVGPRERGARSDEALEVIHKLWNGIEITEPGRFWDASGLVLEPRPVQSPCPLWYGGSEKALARANPWCTGLFTMNPTPDELRGTVVPAVRSSGAQHGRTLDLVVYNYVIVSDDQEWLEREIRPLLLGRLNYCSPAELAQRTPEQVAGQVVPDGRVIWGNAEQCARQLLALLDAGADYLVLDFNFHGVRDLPFAREQLDRFVQQVVPLADKLMGER